LPDPTKGGSRAAAIYTLIETAKLNDVDPLAWLADMLARLQDHPARCIGELLLWSWRSPTDHAPLPEQPRQVNASGRGLHQTRTELAVGRVLI
jgi:hypothetical protein